MKKSAGLVVSAAALCCACSAGSSASPAVSNGGSGGSAGGSGGEAGDAGLDATIDGNAGTGGGTVIPDPVSCDQAAASHTYLGCDFWPTVLDNIVRPDFDFAVVVANTGDADAQVTVTRGGAPVSTATVPANGLVKVYLPWVQELKSTASIAGGCPTNVKTATVRAPGGAYHLTSTIPVAVYQFNAIEYAGQGGPPGKDWSTCQTNTCFGQVDCFSYTNDASLLLPSTALTGNYRIAGVPSWTDNTDPTDPSAFTYPPYFAVTGTQNGTSVTVQMSATGDVAAGGGVPKTSGGTSTTFNVDAGEVVMVVGEAGADFSGTFVQATAPVQVLSGISCTQMPHGLEACDHLEETVMPIETLGKHYFVAAPTGPLGSGTTYLVRLYGNVDGTHVTYPGPNPGAPSVINAGEVVELEVVTQDFELTADNELTVATFQYGAGPMNGSRQGDPAQTFVSSVEQYRLKYIFLAPDDYETNYADVIMPMDAQVMLDGAPLGVAPSLIASGFGVARVQLGPGQGGAHVLTSSAPVGLQVLGYGAYTSYQYPGGLNLGHIAPVPPK